MLQLKPGVGSLTFVPFGFVRDLGRYLGFPLTSGRATHARFSYLLDQVSRRLASWKCKILNTAGRICLANSVLSSIPTYTAQVIWLPRRTVEGLNRELDLLFGQTQLIRVGIYSSGRL